MKMFSKLLSLGLLVSLLVAVPVLAHTHDNKCHCIDTCDIVGSYVGTVKEKGSTGDGLPVEVQFHEDCTATIFQFNPPPADQPIQIFVGAWKCQRPNCFKFCTTNTLPVNTSSLLVALLDGEICFTRNCIYPSGTATLTTTIGDIKPVVSTLSIDLHRVSCCR